MATLEQRIYDGNQAREVLDNEAFAAAFADIKQEINDQWAQSPARDHEGREKLYQLLKLTDKLEATLRTSLETGKLAKLELEHQQSLLDRAKSSIGLT
jgi:predicted ArsR family transcriptional regulator